MAKGKMSKKNKKHEMGESGKERMMEYGSKKGGMKMKKGKKK